MLIVVVVFKKIIYLFIFVCVCVGLSTYKFKSHINGVLKKMSEALELETLCSLTWVQEVKPV